MGLFRKATRAVADTTRYDVATELTLAVSPTIRRARRLEERGSPANGVITGIRVSSEGGTPRSDYAIAVQDADGWRRFGVRTQPRHSHRLRLGTPVVVKLDARRAILEWEAMRSAWNLTGEVLVQEPLRSAPADGIADSTIDARVQRRLKKWKPVQATIESIERCTLLGMPTMNWNVGLRLPDGTTATSTRDAVPAYAQWFADVGAVVPAAVDPDDSGKACVGWLQLAADQIDSVGFDDEPPPGSIAGQLETERPEASRLAGTAPSPPASSTAPVVLDATVSSWVEAVRSGHMKPKAFTKALADWKAAGMCTDAHVAAAEEAAAPS